MKEETKMEKYHTSLFYLSLQNVETIETTVLPQAIIPSSLLLWYREHNKSNLIYSTISHII